MSTDHIILKPEFIKASKLSTPTIHREQRAGRFPPFEVITHPLAKGAGV